MKEWIIITAVALLGVIVVAFSALKVVAAYDFCSNHFPKETAICFFSDRYRVVE